ncbi:MAG: hypothetical protein ACRCWS_08335 [Propionibacteriaceae bacterium]
MAKADCAQANFRTIANSKLPYATAAVSCIDTTAGTKYLFVLVEAEHVTDTISATYKQMDTTEAIGYVDGGTWLAIASSSESATPSLADAEALVKKMGMGKALTIKQ